MKILCIIPARGGSKRIPGKNVTDFLGMPLIAWSIRAALNSGCFGEVMVSTDSEKIASVAREYGAEVPFLRSAATSDDYATTADVLREVLARYADAGKHFDAFCCLYATAPFVMPFRLRQGAELISGIRFEAAFTVMRFSYPPQRGLAISGAGTVAMIHPEYASARSQDLQPIYHDAGQFYFCHTKAFLRDGTLWGPATAPIVLPEEEAQDIDTPSDLRLALLKARMMTFPDEFSTGGFTFRNYTALSDDEHRLVLSERNGSAVREQMVNRDMILEEAHRHFVGLLHHRFDRAYYAVYNTEGLVGSLNIDIQGSGVAERGIWIAARCRGKRIAAPVTEAFYSYLHDNFGINRVLTKVRRANAASNALEHRLGASLTSSDKDYNHYELQL